MNLIHNVNSYSAIIILIMEAVSTSETPVYFCETALLLYKPKQGLSHDTMHTVQFGLAVEVAVQQGRILLFLWDICESCL
jgi:hypothetical protein